MEKSLFCILQKGEVIDLQYGISWCFTMCCLHKVLRVFFSKFMLCCMVYVLGPKKAYHPITFREDHINVQLFIVMFLPYSHPDSFKAYSNDANGSSKAEKY